MSQFSTITALEVAAQFAEDKVASMPITTKPNVTWLRVVYLGDGEFKYYLDGKTNRETARTFAHDVLMQELSNRS